MYKNEGKTDKTIFGSMMYKTEKGWLLNVAIQGWIATAAPKYMNRKTANSVNCRLFYP